MDAVPAHSKTPDDSPSPVRRTAAWGVHLFTASGAVLGTLALLSIATGAFERAAYLMLTTLFIDSVDGTLARKVRVSQVLPDIDGRRLDDMVDYFNFAIVPVFFMVWAGSLPGWLWAAPPILASAYGFSQQNAKTDDHFFLGWPSYWNVLALYLWLMDFSPAAGAAWVTLLAVAVFVPIKYVYPSRMPVLRRTTAALGMAWGLLLAASAAWPELADRYAWVEISLGYVVYYLVLSFWLGNVKPRAGAG